MAMRRRCPHLAGKSEVATEPHDDSFVVVAEDMALDLETLGGEEHWQHAGVSESVGRRTRLRRRAVAEARGPGTTEVCERCVDGLAEVLEDELSVCRTQVELYARSERQHALVVAEAERHRTTEKADDAGLVLDALACARGEALKTRAERQALVQANADLDEREARYWADANAFEWELEAFRDACAQLVTAADRRKRVDDTMQHLADHLATLDPDRASFDAVDAYVRAACRDLNSPALAADHVVSNA